MTPERWERIQELYHAARAQPASDRAQFLDRACADDRVLRREVQALLDQPVSTGGFMDFVGGPAPAQLSDVATSDLTGGPKILDVVQEQLGLPPDALAASRGVLSAYGNCSSPTVLLVLDALRRRPHPPRHVVMLAFGPGLTLYVSLLQGPTLAA